jgi:hypothetical protein
MADGCELIYPKATFSIMLVSGTFSMLMIFYLSVNGERTQRVAELLEDFRVLQHYIAAAPADCTHPDDYYTEGWAALRQCALDGQHILNVAADTYVPRGRTADEQDRVELQQ